MKRSLALTALALLALPALSGCRKLEARSALKEGNTLYQNEQYSAAVVQYERGLKLDPTATFAWRSVGLAALALYRPGDEGPKNLAYAQTAMKAFESYLADNPDDTKVQDYLLSTYVNAKQYDKALAYIAKLEAEHPEERGSYARRRVNVLVLAGRLDQAFAEAQKLPPGNDQAQALNSIGTALWDKLYHQGPQFDAATRQKMADMALAAMKRAIELKPDFFEAMIYYNLLYREKAKIETDGSLRLQDNAQADFWLKKGLDLRRKANAAAAASAKESK